MYLFEWLAYDGRSCTDYDALVRDSNQQIKSQEKLPPISVSKSVSKSITDNESLYCHNSDFIDIRTPNDEKRGLITLIAGTGGAILAWTFIMIFHSLATHYWNIYEGDTTFDPIDFILMSTIPLIPASALFFYIKYVFPYFRLESFTARRLIVRFNRVTRKVYLLRPKHLGGVVALDWDTAEVCIDPNMSELDGSGGFVMLGWDKETHSVRDADGNLKDDLEITFVGKPTRNASELLAFWEYIRRYMEEGPQAAPCPKKLIGKFPWPWRSFMAVWQLDSGFVKVPQLWIFLPIYCLLLPLIIIHACAHWVSLLLCYEPKFPRSIENAGRAGTRPKNT